MFSSFSTKKELPLSGCNLWLSPDLAHCKAEIKSLIETNGGKLCARMSSKVNFVVSRKTTEELTHKVSKYSPTIIPETFLRECVTTNTPLYLYTSSSSPSSPHYPHYPHHLHQAQKENYPNFLPVAPPSNLSNSSKSNLQPSSQKENYPNFIPMAPCSATFSSKSNFQSSMISPSTPQKENQPNFLPIAPSFSNINTLPTMMQSTAMSSTSGPYTSSINTPTTPLPSFATSHSSPIFYQFDSTPQFIPSRSQARGIRERLKGLSLKNFHKSKQSQSHSHSFSHTAASTFQVSTLSASPNPFSTPHQSIPRAIFKAPPATSHRRKQLRNASRALCESLQELQGRAEGEGGTWEDDEESPPLHKLVFVIRGVFSMAQEVLEGLIVTNGGTYVDSISDSNATHLLFGGESIDAQELEQAKDRKIHIVNEYFLRLLVKY